MALTHLVVQYESNFCSVALQFMEEEKNYPLPSPATTGAALTCGRLLDGDPLSEPVAATQSHKLGPRCPALAAAMPALRGSVVSAPLALSGTEWAGRGLL